MKEIRATEEIKLYLLRQIEDRMKNSLNTSNMVGQAWCHSPRNLALSKIWSGMV